MAIITFTYLTGRFIGTPRSVAEGTITISNEDSVDNLHSQIQQLLPHSYGNISFFLRALRFTLTEYRVMRQGIRFPNISATVLTRNLTTLL
ncbi:hypothetical protein GLOIN_2v523502 [Rhizophagus irregularis DAOM 181602=DAOM 197198]|uniref:Uncharacterized protein n=1 Tax=Rhizophagus irregularis (strain DAOM 197198w) TaxID=1432141 RepID=A0A015NIH3_RHIIW|nr:hypothetical protein RirG_007770 [Rhizophagus irregularis DAOM 197198w]GBC42297.1 hypothetical protein GLOIN_2v523502 [Rhizophagus irregularis DAOM 181602=DAOM 197198]